MMDKQEHRELFAMVGMTLDQVEEAIEREVERSEAEHRPCFGMRIGCEECARCEDRVACAQKRDEFEEKIAGALRLCDVCTARCDETCPHWTPSRSTEVDPILGF